MSDTSTRFDDMTSTVDIYMNQKFKKSCLDADRKITTLKRKLTGFFIHDEISFSKESMTVLTLSSESVWDP